MLPTPPAPAQALTTPRLIGPLTTAAALMQQVPVLLAVAAAAHRTSQVPRTLHTVDTGGGCNGRQYMNNTATGITAHQLGGRGFAGV